MRSPNRLSVGLMGALVALSISLQPMVGKTTPWDVQMKDGRDALKSGDYSEARRSLTLALDSSKMFRTNDPRLGETYASLGELYLGDQEYAQAKEYFNRALMVQQTIPGIEEAKLADTLYGLATASEMLGDREMAVVLLKRVRDIWSKQYGSRSPKLIGILKPLGIYATVNGDFKVAEECYRQLISIQQETSAPKADIGASLNLLASTLTKQNKMDEAASTAERAVSMLGTGDDTTISLEAAKETLAYVRQETHQTSPEEHSAPATEIAVRVPEKKPATASKPVVASGGPPSSKPAIATTETPASKPAASSGASSNKPAIASTEALASTPTVANSSPPSKPLIASSGPATKEEVLTRAPVISPSAITASKPPVVEPPVSKAPVAKAPPAVEHVEQAAETAVEQKPEISEKPIKQKLASDTVSTKHVMTAPTSGVVTQSSDFRPWEYKMEGGETTVASASTPGANWGKIRYLAGGRLITKEEYQAMLLANEAYELIKTEKYKMATDILKKALAIAPNLASAHVNLGLAETQVGETDEAIDHLKHAIAIDPNRASAWLNLASAFQLSGQLKASLVTYNEYTKRFPKDPMAVKATEIAKHLAQEVKEQSEIADGSNVSDYYAFASHQGAVRWSTAPAHLKVYIESPSGNATYRPVYDGFAQDAFRQWSTASSDKVAFDFVKKPEGADIDWRWTDDSNKVSSVAEGGETKVNYAGKKIDHATITVLTKNPAIDSPLSPNQIRAVSLHEIGHALGLIGHSPKPQDIMFCSMPPALSKPALSSRDVATIGKLYSTNVSYSVESRKLSRSL